MKALFIGLLVPIFFLLFAYSSSARVDKITWCHCEPNGNCQTLELPQQALENAGHVNAQGNPLHAGDHAGVCVEPSVTPSVTPSITPSPTPSATPTVSVTPTATPTPTPCKENCGTPPDLFDENSCTVKDCSVVNKSGQPLLPPSMSGK